MKEADVDDIDGELVAALTTLQDVADEITADEAVDALDEATLQVFWRDWPNISSWAGAVWRRLNQDMAGPASPPRDSDLDEVGGEGG